jgi:MipA family protein
MELVKERLRLAIKPWLLLVICVWEVLLVVFAQLFAAPVISTPYNRYRMAFRSTSVIVGIIILAVFTRAKGEDFARGLDGDMGLGGYYTRSIIRSKSNEFRVLPYLDFEYGRIFARVDTLGFKTLKLGYGYLELTGKISQDGFKTSTPDLYGLKNRKTSIPLGIGTLQVTPIGAFIFNAFHDVNQSHGNLVEMLYGGELDLPDVTIYPLAGAEYQTRQYVRYYYGISTQESASSQYASYQPSGAFNDFIGLIIDFRITDIYHLNLNLRRKWLGNSIKSSPIVSHSYLDTDDISLSYRFK